MDAEAAGQGRPRNGQPNRAVVAREREDIAPEARRLLRGIVRRQVLERVVVLEATRRRALVRSEVPPSARSMTTPSPVTDGGRDGQTFRQIEFELDAEAEGSGHDVPAVDRVVAAIKEAGAHVEREQKFAKALGIAPPTGARQRQTIGRGSTLGALVQRTPEASSSTSSIRRAPAPRTRGPPGASRSTRREWRHVGFAPTSRPSAPSLTRCGCGTPGSS